MTPEETAATVTCIELQKLNHDWHSDVITIAVVTVWTKV
jgi:hypothetical protein